MSSSQSTPPDATPRVSPTYDSPTQSSTSKANNGKATTTKKSRDERNFKDENVTRGAIQAIEESQAELVSTMKKGFLDIALELKGYFSDELGPLKRRMEIQEQRTGIRQSIEQSVTRSPTPEEQQSREQSVPPPKQPILPPKGSPPRRLPNKEPRKDPRQHSVYETPRIGSEPAPTYPAPKTKITGNIEPLSDGKNPLYLHWKVSVLDRLQIYADHYPNARMQMALIWAVTIGDAHTYLFPRYQSGMPDQYLTVNEMFHTLDEYFTTGFETEDFREKFDRMEMGKGKDQHGKAVSSQETFVQFSGRFKSLAILGQVSGNDWFHQMWNKITPALQDEATPVKNTWKRRFDLMNNALTAIDM